MTPARGRRLRRSLSVFAVVLIGCWPALVPGVAVADSEVAFTIRDRRITESSGLATDEPNRRYWTVNDSGDRGAAYAVDTDGKVLGSVSIAAGTVDIEAVALRDNVIYLADIGDNEAERAFVTVYYFTDPDPGDERRSYRAVDFAYPDGPHDAEAFLMDADGRMYIVTKGATGGIYRAPAEPSRAAINRLERVGDAPAYVTDGVWVPAQGEAAARIALRTYVSVEMVDPETFAVDARAAAPLQPQGESITLRLGGKSLLLGSEGRNSRVWSVDIPTSVGEASSPAATPPSATASPSGAPTPAPSASASAPSSADPGDDDGEDQMPAPSGGTGTLVAVGLAAALAVVAAAVVIVVRKPSA